MPTSIDRAFEEALRLHHSGDLGAAERNYRQILATNPQHADSMHLLGVIGLQSGHLEPALALISQAIELRPEGAIYRSNLGQVLERLGRDEEALRAYSNAIELDPDCVEALNNRGLLLQKRDALDDAEADFRAAIRIAPDYAEPYTNLGNLLKDRGDLDHAIDCFRRAIELRPDISMLHSNLLLTLHYHADFSPADLAREHRLWAERHVRPLVAERAPHRNPIDPDRRLRVGYVSPDFRDHAVARFMLPLLESHDPGQVETFAYADILRPDVTTAAVRGRCHHWRDISGIDDAGLAAQIRDDGIDVLVDLAAHTGRNRLLAFARKPAPVQFTYLAYCSTTGVDAIDYRLTDRFLDPPSADLSCYTESSIHLPGCYWCYAAPVPRDAPQPATDRQAGPPTFGCLNNYAKVTDATLLAWTQLLCRVPESRLLVYARSRHHQARLSSALQQADLDPSRLDFVGWQPLQSYLETYTRIDVALDPYPYGGGTTSCDALWMGVPVVSMTGDTAVSRAGLTLLTHAGLPDLVADNPEDYVSIAADLIRDTNRLAKIRSGLRSQLEASSLMDAPQFARGIESAYREAWRTWCNDPR